MNEIIRHVERNILDTEYTSFKILTQEEDLAIGHLLKVAGDYWRDLRDVADEPLASVRTRFNLMIGGLTHCIRWIVAGRNKSMEFPAVSWQEMDREALELLVWGMRYHSLSTDHICWSRNMLQASVDSINKIIKFFPVSNFDQVFFLSQQIELQQILEALFNTLPTQVLGRDFQKWKKQFRVVDRGFDFPPALARKLPSYTAVANWLEECLLPNVNPAQDLGGYSLIEFRHFFATLFINCNFSMWLEDSFDSTFGSVNDFGTLVLTLPYKSMITWLQKMSGLKISSIKAIVTAFTFDASDLHSSLTVQPFVLSSTRHLFLLPRLIALSDPGRMLVGAMNKGVGRPIYAKLVESISRTALSEIAAMFRDLGLEVWQEKKIIDYNGKELTPDLIILDRNKSELIVADYKHSLTPVGPSEVIYKLSELQKGLKQVHSYLAAVRSEKTRISGIRQQGTNNIMGLLIFGNPMIVPMYIDPDVAITTRHSLKQQLTRQHFTALSDLLIWIRTRPDLPFKQDEMKEHTIEIMVSEWKYSRTVFMPK